MLNRIIRFSIQHKLVIGVLTLALVVWGVWSATRLPVDALPDITDNQVQIITQAPTLATQEVEQFITYPIERAMANLPDVVEMRSFSRFGLSVITIVFEEHVNVYFARQLIGEKLKAAEADIPGSMGHPTLAPVTTGLGEIYQYVLRPKKGSEHKYSPMELRTLQDWVVSRQLYGIEGVAEVTGFGGVTRQYEVAVNPARLKAMNTSLTEIFAALERNNQNTGGAYIDKKPNAYFIRGVGLIKTFADIENTVIKTVGGIPVLIRDVATVGFGSPPRYGAITYNGESEVAGGIVLMLKGANSNEVVRKVKQRIEAIKKTLPPDVILEPFLDRSQLVKRAISTVETNLIEGALIVVFVLLLFLGNLRAGLIVASAIPLALLFALAMMNLFGVSANLMSLGAIDFGLIVDGAVIIVEATMHHLGLRKSARRLTQSEMDEEVFMAASKIRNSAAFGEIIILIVYIPILTLVGIEGKMFRPMAQTVGFAIVGALVLSLTYIPMMSALFLSKNPHHKTNISDRMMQALQRWYEPLLKAALKARVIVVAITVALFIVALIVFSRMGGEFMPTLEEGDYAIEFALPQGSSLTQTVETMLQAERMLNKYPEVKIVVGKTGAADVATDPMPMHASDLMVILKPKKEWTTTKDFYELADMMQQTLSEIPGVYAEPSQPIQMRFNELMTGIRQDVAVKIFGENLDTLARLAPLVAKAIAQIDGVAEPVIERTTGLPQISIEYDRVRLAGYGLHIDDVNDAVSTAFAGKVAGFVFENERRFDLVVRLDSASRMGLQNVADLYIPAANGVQVPLSQVAQVSFKAGPAQISREDGKRRVVVGFNVRGRDVESVVDDIKSTLNKPEHRMPVGYYTSFGGTFENLQHASARLQIAVPVALLLIFVLLYFTFQSVGYALLIFTAIPMSAIGGVFALLLRGMPFSISAGIGFIALFGVAVLNGIVLISTFIQLRKTGMHHIEERIMEGTRIRLRPVLMTAAVASLGFLPMALSQGSGAEVQRPLATVVIGGLITASFLTLFVLPALYAMFSRSGWIAGKQLKTVVVFTGFLLTAFNTSAQTRISAAQAVQFGLQNNLQFQLNDALVQQANTVLQTARPIPKTGFFVENEDLRPSDNRGILKIGVTQTLNWPGVYKAQRKLFEEQLQYQQLNKAVIDAFIIRQVDAAYYSLWYLQEEVTLYEHLDSLHSTMYAAADLRVKTGEAAGLERIAANARWRELQSRLSQLREEMTAQQMQLSVLLNTDSVFLPLQQPLPKLSTTLSDGQSVHPMISMQQQNVNTAKADIAVQQNLLKPEFSGRFFSQRLYGLSNPFTGFSVATSIPLFGRNYYSGKIKFAEAAVEVAEKELALKQQQLLLEQSTAMIKIRKAEKSLQYYEATGRQEADEIIAAATLAYKAGEISFFEMYDYYTQAINIRRNYLEALNNYNQAIINYKYYLHR